MAATRIVRELISAKVVEEIPASKRADLKEGRSIGRPKIGLQLRTDAVFGAGMTISAYHSEVSVSDSSGRIIGRAEVRGVDFARPAACAGHFAQSLKDLIAELGVPMQRICGVGVVLAAKVDPRAGIILGSEYFGWKNDGGGFCECLREELGAEIVIRNIADALALTEMRFGVARALDTFALIHTATLTGASFVSGGQIVAGHDGFAGRIGHLRHVARDYACICGRNDCLALSTTGFAILKSLGLNDDPVFRTRCISTYAGQLMQALEAGCDAEVEAAGRENAQLVDTINMLFRPEKVIVTGFLGSTPQYLEGVRAGIRAFGRNGGVEPEQVVRGRISAVEAAPMLALAELCFSDNFDFPSFLESADLVADAVA